MPKLLRNCLLLLVFVALIASCGRGRRSSGNECFDNGDCNDELGNEAVIDIEACRDGECDDVECLSSTDCVVGTYCDVEDEDYVCRDGCEADSDCFAGERCEAGACVIYGCRSTVLDCGFNEVCNEDTGQCETAPGLQCTQCDPAGHYMDDMGTTDPCDDQIAGHQLCGGDGNFCGPEGDNNNVCWVSCDAPGDPNACPAGFVCQPLTWTPQTWCDPVELAAACLPVQGCDPFVP